MLKRVGEVALGIAGLAFLIVAMAGAAVFNDVVSLASRWVIGSVWRML